MLTQFEFYVFIPRHKIVAGYYAHDSGGVLWFHVGHPRICLSFRQSYVHPSVFSFPDNNLSKRQWIFTKLGMCIDIVEIWFGFANGQILSFFYRVICPLQDSGGVL